MSATILQQVSAGLEHHIASQRAFTIVWSRTPDWPRQPSSAPQQQHHIAVLDASFNPPTLAHLALAKAHTSIATSSPNEGAATVTGNLLLYSTRNADKGTGKQGDATPEQRLHMVVLLANASGLENVAVACCTEPLVAGKSTLLHREIGALNAAAAAGPHPSPPPLLRLTFLIGWDTLTRVFAPKYYDDMAHVMHKFFDEEQSTLICARRGAQAAEEDAFLATNAVVEFSGRPGLIEMVDLAPQMVDVSSTRVRATVKEFFTAGGGQDEEQFRRRLEELVTDDVASYILEHSLYRA
jgi:nicotinamide-nucleotide adenylyltransferase